MVSKLIQPVTQADELLKRHGIFSGSTPSFDADGQQTALTVPEGERHTYFAFSCFRSSGNRTVVRWELTDVSDGNSFVIDTFAAASEDYFSFQAPITLEEGDSVSLRSSGGSTASVYLVRSWVSREDAF